MILRSWQKIVLIPILILALLGPVLAPFAESFSFPDRYDLVAILVEQGLYSDTSDFLGLSATVPAVSGLRRTTLKARVDRYAADIQNALPGTRAVIIQTDRFEETQNIASVLERLYFEGDPKEPNRIAYLKGAIFVGEVPLPVVNKQGNRFISLYPYTDFEQKAYVWNPRAKDFEQSGVPVNPQPEIWHGVIRPPVSTALPEGKNAVAEYFDKNHLYHKGDPRYADFGKRLFFQDFTAEKKNLSPDAYKNYLNFTNHMGDVAYSRYTKDLYSDLAGPVEAELAQLQGEVTADASQLRRAGIPVDDSRPEIRLSPEDQRDLDEAAEEAGGAQPQSREALAKALPDILTKWAKMSDKLMFRFYELFTKYPAQVNDMINGTGRYVSRTEEGVKFFADSAVNLISAKDAYTLEYLKQVNTKVEEKIDEIVHELQKDVAFETVKMSITDVKTSAGWLSAEDEFDNEIEEPVEFVNFSPAAEYDGLGADFEDDDADLPARLNGWLLTELKDVSQCSPYRGTRGSGELGNYAKLVELNRAFDENTSGDQKKIDDETYASSGRTQEEVRSNKRCERWGDKDDTPEDTDFACEGNKQFAGCYYGGEECFPELATDPIFVESGTREVEGDPPAHYDDFNSCLVYREKKHFALEDDGDIDDEGRASYLQTAFYRLDAIRNNEEEKEPLTPRDRSPSSTVLYDDDNDERGIVTLQTILSSQGKSLSEFLAQNNAGNIEIAIAGHTGGITGAKLLIQRVPEPVKIPSEFFHKEPLNETLNAQAQSFSTRDLPVDDPRYVTFQDSAGGVQKIVYPDLYKALEADPEAAIAKFRAGLEAVEAKLNAVPRASGVAAPCNRCLQNLLGAEDAPIEEPRVKDSIAWKNLDIDGKHKYLFDHYLDRARPSYVGESAQGYEMAYFNGKGNASAYEFSLNPDVPEDSGAGNLDEGFGDEPSNPFDFPPTDSNGQNGGQDGGYDLFSWSPPPVSPWWDRMGEWISGLTASKFEFGLDAGDFYADLEEGNEESLEAIRQQSRSFNSAMTTGEELPVTRVKSLSFEADSNVAAAGKRAEVLLMLKDADGKLVRDEFGRVTLTLEGGGRFGEDVLDDQPNEPGVQVIVMNGGMLRVPLVAGESAGSLKLKAIHEDSGAVAEFTLIVSEVAKLVLQSSTLGTVADGEGVLNVQIFARDGESRVITGARGKVNVGVSDPLLGTLKEETVMLNAGRAQVSLQVGKKSGPLFLHAVSGAFDPGDLQINMLPGAPVRIGLKTSSKTLSTAPGSSITLEAWVFDEFGNAVTTNSSAEIDFKITPQTERFGQLSSYREKAENGVAKILVTPQQETGFITIIAEGGGLDAASMTIKTAKLFGTEDLKNMKADSLTAALLGIPAGDVSAPGFLAGAFLQSGRVQAVTSLTADPEPKKKLFEINGNGGISIDDPERITASFLPANNFSLIFRDTQLQSDVAVETLFASREGQFQITDEPDPAVLADGIYMRKIAQGEEYRIDLARGAMRLVKDEEEKLEIQTNGFTRIFDNALAMKPRPGDFLVLDILEGEETVAQIFFVQRLHQNVISSLSAEDAFSQIDLEAPGAYVTALAGPPQITSREIYTGNSTAAPRGIGFFDASQAQGNGEAGFSAQSLEDSNRRFGVGFGEDNKFALLFAAGEMFGEANRHYASEIGIVMGDPTVRVKEEAGDGFTTDIGKILYAGSADIRAITPLDFNTDGHEDLILSEGEGKLRLIQNNGTYDGFKDQGYIADIKSGIQDMAKADVNNDGQTDLIIAGSEACRQGDTCLDVYENQGGAFARRNLRFAAEPGGETQKEKIVTLRAFDLTKDRYPDLVMADTAGNIKILYNNRGTFEREAQVIGNIGLTVDPTQNLIQSVLVNYPGMKAKIPNDPDAGQIYFSLENKDYMYADFDGASFANSVKQGEDLNGGVVQTGDRIRYTITLKNAAGSARSGVAISDSIAESLQLDADSLKCEQCGAASPKLLPISTSDPARQYLFTGITVPARQSRSITYEAVYMGSLSASPKVVITASGKFKDRDPVIQAVLKQDNFLDLSVTKTDNPTGRVLYFYSQNLDAGGRMQYGSTLSSPQLPVSLEDYGQTLPTADGAAYPKKCVIGGGFLSLPIQDSSSADPEPGSITEERCAELSGVVRPAGAAKRAQDELLKMQTEDKDGDGLLDSIDNLSGGLDDAAEVTANAINSLTCSAGCIPMPFNAALFAPGLWNIMGEPAGFDPGLPVFGWGAPPPIPTFPPAPPMSTLGGRIYVSPTLTGGVGFAVCLGSFNNYGAGKNCFSFGINPLDLLPGNICDTIGGAVSGAMAAANSAISDASEGLTVALGGGGGNTGGASRRSSGSGMGNYSLGNYDAPSAASRNIRVPGFPSVIADWWSAQMEEFTDKMLQLPDLYFIYPDPVSLVPEAKKFGQLVETIDEWADDPIQALLVLLNSLPLLDIETQEVLLKIPFFTPKEIQKLKADALQWVEDERLELDKWTNLLRCFSVDALNPELCRFVTAEMGGLINSVTANIQALDEWILFPKKIYQLRAVESYYLTQIMGYLDAVTQLTGGWLKKQTARVAQWRRAVRDIKDTVATFQGFLDVMIDYQESCDSCKSERFSLMELIMKLFVAIPTPPVIPLPKLPDIIFDASKFQAGLKIFWPDIKFKMEPLTIPKLPRITLGVNLDIPLFKLMIPQIPVIPKPPELPQLPPLPTLQLPKLPDLPPAPTMPALPDELQLVTDILKKIFKIYCIIKLGFTPTDEIMLKTRIEQITARGLTPILPIDLLLTIVSPTIKAEYVDQILVTLRTNLKVDFSEIQRVVEEGAQSMNEYTTDFTKIWSQAGQAASKQIEKYTSPTIKVPTPSVEGREFNYLEEHPGLAQAFEYGDELRKAFLGVAAERDRREKIIGKMPEKLVLKVESEPYQPQRSRAQQTDDLTALSFLNEAPILKNIQALKDKLAANRSSRGLATLSYLASTDPIPARMLAAAEGNTSPVSGPPPFAADPIFQASPQNRGIFTVDNEEKSKRLVYYTGEVESESHLADLDIEGDGDSDKIYTYGKNLYIKENHRRAAPEERQKFRPVDIEIWTLFELLPASAAPNFPQAVKETTKETAFTFRGAPTEDVAGYEVLAKQSPFFFESAAPRDSLRLHLIPEIPKPAPSQSGAKFALVNPEGSITVNNETVTALTASADDFVATGENSSVTLQGGEGTVIRMSEETGFLVPKGSFLELDHGSLEIEIPREGSAYFPAGMVFYAKEGSIRIRLFDGSEMKISEGETLALPEIRPLQAAVQSLSGTAEFKGRKREYITSRNSPVHVSAGEVLHPLGVTRLEFGGQPYTFSQNILVPIPESFGSGTEVSVQEGTLEVIRAESGSQPVAAGMALFFGDEVEVRNGAATVRYARGGDHQIRFRETYRLERLTAPENPTAQLQLPEAFYFAEIAAFNSAGRLGTVSEKLLASPQVCGDDSPPIANAGASVQTVSVGKTLVLDASRSFDLGGRVIGYYLDTDAETDSDGDGTKNNDRNVFEDTDPAKDTDSDGDTRNDGDAHIITLGPYLEVGQKKMRLIVTDDALNEGYQDLTVNIVTPVITLEGPPLQGNVITGLVTPPDENIPVTIARLKAGSGLGWEMLKTPSANSGGQYFTDASGRYRITDADLRNRLEVRNAAGEVVAEVNPETGRITVLDSDYETRVALGEPPNLPMRVGVYPVSDPSLQNPLTFVYAVPDVNTDVTIDNPRAEYNAEALQEMNGAHIKPLAEASKQGLSLRVLPGDDLALPGAVVVERGGKRVATLDVNGDLITADPLVTVRVKSGESSEPLVFELLYNGNVVAEMFIAAHLGESGSIGVVDVPVTAPRPEPRGRAQQRRFDAVGASTVPFTDVNPDDPFAKVAGDLFERGIIAGSPNPVTGELEFRPESFLNRAEFTQITEKLLCIVPREEAHKLPSPFYDVLDPSLWFYAVLKEGNIRGFIKGYLGEARVNADGTSQTPFKPANNITRAEAATIVLAALNEERIIDLSKANLKAGDGEQWYDPYVRVAQDLTPYVVDPKDKAVRSFLITKDEAARPLDEISRRDFAIMAHRVLLIYDCNDLDFDDDGLPDTWELSGGLPALPAGSGAPQVVIGRGGKPVAVVPSEDAQEETERGPGPGEPEVPPWKVPGAVIRPLNLADMNPDDDLDGDRCTNAREYELGTSPFSADTDGGGTGDCDEAAAGTNPAGDENDDILRPIIPNDLVSDAVSAQNSAEGIYVFEPPCGDICPCRATLSQGADLSSGDTLFSAITGPGGIPMYAKSNEEKY